MKSAVTSTRATYRGDMTTLRLSAYPKSQSWVEFAGRAVLHHFSERLRMINTGDNIMTL
jgi:hypothetical protein